jgi:hypothetical protein
VSRHLKNELPVPALMEKATGGRSPDWEAAEHERTGAETEILPFARAVLANHLDCVSLSQPSFRNDEIRALAPEQIAGVSETRTAGTMNERGVLRLVGQSVDPRRRRRLATQRSEL